MAKISGFHEDFKGLSNNEAWQRIYEYGKNYMPIREKRIQKAYMKIFRPKTKVIRDGIIEKVKTDYIVPGDYVIIEAGQFVPVDGKILEKENLELINNLDGAEKEFVYQGAKVITGKAVIEAIKTSDVTYTAEKIKQIDNYNKKKSRFERNLKRWAMGVTVASLILGIFACIFTMVVFSDLEIVERIFLSLGAGFFYLFIGIPVGFISATTSCFSRQYNVLKACKLKMKRLFSLPEAEKVTLLCLDDEFLEGEHSRRIERLYEVGISIAVVTDKKLDDIAEKVQSVGICNGGIAAITNEELAVLEEEDFQKALCDNFVFCELDKLMKERIIRTYEAMGIRCMVSGYGLEEIATIEFADIGITRNNEKRSLDYELADAALYSYNFAAIYELIRQSFIFSCNLKNYIYHILVFQFPILLFVLIMLINHINLNELWWQAILMIFAVIPGAMFLVSKDYTKSRLIDLKEDKDKFIKRFVICLFVSIGIVALILIEGLVGIRLGLDNILSVNLCFGTFAGLILAIAIVEKVKFPYKGKMALRGTGAVAVNAETIEKEIIIEKTAEKEADDVKSVEEKQKIKEEKKEKTIKQKPVKEKPAKKKDIGNEML